MTYRLLRGLPLPTMPCGTFLGNRVKSPWCRALFCWSRGRQAWLVLDNVIHAFGSLAHATIRGTLLASGCSASLVDLLVFAIRSMLLHMGSYQGVEEALARYEASLGQGNPISALLCCLPGELRAALALTSTGLLATPAGPLRRLGWIDDTSWLAESHSDAQRLVSQLPASGAATNLFSNNLKTIAIGTELHLGHLHILNEPLFLLGIRFNARKWALSSAFWDDTCCLTTSTDKMWRNS